MKSDGKNDDKESITNLVDIVSHLRDPDNGCPWDKAQTHDSLIPFLLEEAHEVAHAIREGTKTDLKEELGDLLLQIVLHAQISKEEKEFNLSDIAEGISQKLIRRHPHVFKKKTFKTVEEVKEDWDRIKSQEKYLKISSKPISENLRLKIRSQTAINGALIISKKVTKSGFQWQNIDSIWEKLYEELRELKEAINSEERNHAQEELGDVIFTLINLAHWYNLSPEEGLAKTNQKILNRFSFLEEKSNGNIRGLSIKKLKQLWEAAKHQFNSQD